MTGQTDRYKIHAARKREQPEKDVARIRHAMDQSNSYRDFKGRLSEQFNNHTKELIKW